MANDLPMCLRLLAQEMTPPIIALGGDQTPTSALLREAADAIEALEKERESYSSMLDKMISRETNGGVMYGLRLARELLTHQSLSREDEHG